MAVIINEFEVVVEAPKQADSDSANQQPQATPAARLSPRDLQILQSYRCQRDQRVVAH